jgi:hypothetical protein|tara:strand:+ start:125 stop:664 length:540 start_codon:yes stop_codon:yes gene_type:complete
MKTISEGYKKLQQELHQNPNYGIASTHFAPIVSEIIEVFKINSLADYGAGKKRLYESLEKLNNSPQEYFPYDPAFPEYGEPKSADLVCCIDVLEHIEPDLIDNVIKELSLITTNIGFYTIHMGPAGKVLSDGRNAHLIQQPSSWWLEKLVKYFDVIELRSHQMMGKGLWLIVQPKKIGN